MPHLVTNHVGLHKLGPSTRFGRYASGSLVPSAFNTCDVLFVLFFKLKSNLISSTLIICFRSVVRVVGSSLYCLMLIYY